MQDLGTGGNSGFVHAVDRLPATRAERHVQLPSLASLGRAQPEVGRAVRAGERDDERVADRKAHHLAHPDRRNRPDIERERLLHVCDLHAEMIDHQAHGTAARGSSVSLRLGGVLRSLRDAEGGPSLGVRVLAALVVIGMLVLAAPVVLVPVLRWLAGALL